MGDDAREIIEHILDHNCGAKIPRLQFCLAKCHAHARNDEAASKLLLECKAAAERKEMPRDPALNVLLSEVLTRLGRSDEADDALLSLSYKDLQASTQLPTALSTQRREEL